jgi:hypothetical protein
MEAFIRFIEQFDMGGMTVLVLVLMFVGNKTSQAREGTRRLCWGIAAIVLVVYVAHGLFVRRMAATDQLTELTFRALLAAGFVLGVLWILSPLCEGLHRNTIGRLESWLSATRKKMAARKAQREQERLRQRQQEAFEREAPERERASRRAAKQAEEAAKAQRTRENARAACELLYNAHAPELATRFPRQDLDDFLCKQMGDDRIPEYVEERGQQLLEIIRKHVEKADPPKKIVTLADLARWYLEQKDQIDRVALSEDDKKLLLSQLEERYVRLQEKYLRTVEP